MKRNLVTGAKGFIETGQCLPSGTQMTDEDLERVIPVIKRAGKQP